MSQTRPFREDVNWIQGDTLQYSFTFNEDDSPLDLTAKDEITVILRNKNSTIFTHTVTGGDLTISPNNKISGEASSEVMDIANRSYDLIIFFDNDMKQTWVMFDVKIFDENSELHSSASDWTIDIDTTAGTVSGQATQQIVNPNGIILVDGRYTQNSGVLYDDIDLAITGARARIADDWDKAVIKAYLDSSGVPIGLGDNDYYDLQDEGIYFESEFDPVNRLINGGDFDVEELLYTYDLEETNINLNF